MAAKKFYGVRRGKITGAFNTWEDCKNSVDGYAGAEFKGFASLEEAKEYLGDLFCPHFSGGSEALSAPENEEPEFPQEGTLLTYVDGSYDDSLKKYAFSCIFLLPDRRIFVEYGNGDTPQFLQHRNVTGELLGAMYAAKFAMLNGFPVLELRYDYEGIEKWVTGVWRARTELTAKYAAYMREWRSRIEFRFTKVPAHAHVYYNELADKMAKKGLTMGTGVPKVRRIEDMEEYHGTD